MQSQKMMVMSALCRRHEVSEWVMKCLQEDDPTPRAIALNFLSDLFFSNISRETVNDTLNKLEEYIYENKQSKRGGLHNLVSIFGEKHPELLCGGIEIYGGKRIFSRIIEIEDILAHGLKKRFFVYVDDAISSKKGPDTLMRIYNAVKKHGKGQIEDSQTAKEIASKLGKAQYSFLGPFRGRLPIFWFTLSEEIEQMRDISCSCCDNICYAVGKPTIKGAHLVEVRFSLEDKKCKCPTIIDSDFRLPFISVSGSWGKCLNLKELKIELSEAIHFELQSFPPNFEMEYLGATCEEIPEPKEEQIKRICEILEENLNRMGIKVDEIMQTLRNGLQGDL